jgi:predicted aminopeptidase
MVKKFFIVLGIVLVILLIWYRDLVSYGIQQGLGQMHIIMNAEPVEDYLKNPMTPDSVRQKLVFIQEVREYAIDSLGLNDTENYTTMYDQKGKPVLWVVTGARPFAFEAMEWDFPVVGKVPYKGFFKPELAQEEVKLVQSQGYEAGVRTVGGWSTLGWFKDPILSNMLDRSWGDLANLIIHEMSHSTIFVKDSVTFNENLASFIGDKGALKFLKDRYGSDSEEYLEYIRESEDERIYYEHVLRGADSLALLYGSFSHDTDSLYKAQAKDRVIRKVVETLDTLSFSFPYEVKKRLGKELPNNTFFMSFMRYREKQRNLDTLYEEKYNRNIKYMINALKQKHPFL